ncbi:MAG: T9SS type A sorting domain-containing protein [Bacteroidetes bacterium]|nr:T9SS type A sorting domain-containing protein [Bacteroidota bacterium]MBS1539558.1 T9SS type A sorting domain-containing protein [Bacteroidota bacterium]
MNRLLLLLSIFLFALVAGIRLKKSQVLSSVKEHDQEEKMLDKKELDADDKELEEENEHMDGPMEFLKYHQGIRTRADQSEPGYPKNYQWTELQKAQQASARRSSLSARTQSGNGVSAFTERGPGNVPGRTRGLIVDPDDATNKTWFAGSASGGIWKTTDAGTSWQWLTPNIPNLATTTLAMAPSNHQIIYAGTGEGFGLVDGITGSGIFLSTNKGSTWNLLPSTSAFNSVNRIIVNPNDATNVLAATNNGIYLSTNQGSSWTKVFTGVVQDLRATPGNFSIIYAAQYGVGVLKSIDGGQTWNLSNTGMSPSGRVEIAVSPANANNIIASAEGSLSGGNSDLYFSANAGSTWSLVSMKLSGKALDYLGTQGWYDNTVAFSPYNPNIVYIGGIGIYQITLGASLTSSVYNYNLQQINTATFMSLVNFGATTAGGVLAVGTAANGDSVAIKFGPGLSQLAHRFLVPVGATSGVPATNYTYQDYVSVPFQVWDLTKNQQLMVSFRDQNRNGVFDLIPQNTSSTDATQQSREYIYVNNVPYALTPNSSIATAGGQLYQEMYNVWPVLASSATWTPNALPISSLKVSVVATPQYSSTVSSVVDPYGNYDSKNAGLVHPDQHNIYPIPINPSLQTFQLLAANDGGVFLSGQSASPGTSQGEWKKVGNGYNTSQFYGADKKPGAQEYFGGTQDNGTSFTPSGRVSSATTSFTSAIGGDGFEVLWHSQNPNMMIGGSQYNGFERSTDGGQTWNDAITGFPLSGSSPDQNQFPFISKLAHSKQAPNIIYSVGSGGVWRSTNFGGSWALTTITSNWGLSSFADIEVSRANANIVWAGAGQGTGSNLFVSTNMGKTFTAVPNPPGKILGNLTRIATHPTNPNIAYVLYSFAKTSKILMTQNLGQTWTDISGFGTGTTSVNGFPDVAVYSLYVRPDNTNIMWAGTEIGIVESLDGGNTWNLLTSFPSVAVWDMKGQDNEVVIATHGRGIWTAELSVDQNANFPVPSIITSGTSPQSRFVMQANFPKKYDSVQLVINSKTLSFKPSQSGIYNISISGVPSGNVAVQMIGYVGAGPVYAPSYSGYRLSLQAYQKQYYDFLESGNNFYQSGLTIQPFGPSNSSLQSSHNYAANTDASATLLVPIIVASSGNTNLLYQDVAIVTALDSVFVEGTKDGITWRSIANGYNAKANNTWLTALNGLQSGDPTMQVTETFNLKNTFSSNDTILVRFRLHANAERTTAWGWSVDELFIQMPVSDVQPAAINSFVIFPNPSPTGNFYLQFSLAQKSEVSAVVWDMTGQMVTTANWGTLDEGQHQYPISIEAAQPGTYLVQVKTPQSVNTLKIVKSQ